MRAASISKPNFNFINVHRKIKMEDYRPVNKKVLAASFVLIAINVVLFAGYIWGVNSYASDGYQITKLNNNLTQLSQENKSLNIQVSEMTSVADIQNESQNQNFVPAGQGKFLQISHYSEAYNQ